VNWGGTPLQEFIGKKKFLLQMRRKQAKEGGKKRKKELNRSEGRSEKREEITLYNLVNLLLINTRSFSEPVLVC